MKHCLLSPCPYSCVLFVIVHNYGRKVHRVFLMHKSLFILYFSLDEILHPRGRTSSVHESASVNLSLSTKKSNFSTPVSGLHLFKNLLMSTFHSPPRKLNFSTPLEGIHLFRSLLLSGYHSPPKD